MRRGNPARGIRHSQYSVSSAHQKRFSIGSPTVSTISREIRKPHHEPHRPTDPSGWMETGNEKAEAGSSLAELHSVARQAESGTISSSITHAWVKSFAKR